MKSGRAGAPGNSGWWGGVLLAVTVAAVALPVSEWIGVSLLGFGQSPVSAIMVAILIGMLVANGVRLPKSLLPGLRFCGSTLLRVGIMLLGVRLSLFGAGKFTLLALPFVAAAIIVGLTTVSLLGRTLGLSRQLAGLIAVGTSICGCTAIVAVAPLVRANEEEVSYAIACVTLFGVVAMFAYPLLAHWAFPDSPVLAGLFLGTSIHETAQVAGAGMMYQTQYSAPLALDTATVTKLVRNLCMIAVIPLIGVVYGVERHAGSARRHWLGMIPWFIAGFALMSALRTVGDFGDRAFGLVPAADWRALIDVLKLAAERLLLVAMAAIGLTSMFAGMLKIGARPFALGLFAALSVGGLSFVLIAVAGAALVALVG